MSQPRRPVHRRPAPELPPIPIWFKIWFAVCATIGAGLVGLVVWALIRIVERYA